MECRVKESGQSRILNKWLIVSFIFSVLFVISCKEEPSDSNEKIEKKEVMIPRFNVDSAYQKVEKQLSFGPRIPGTEEHVACKNWFVEILESYGAEVIDQQFRTNASYSSSIQAHNIVGRFNKDYKKRILLAAHWDSRHIADADQDEANHSKPVPGADDGASGVAVLLEIARIIQENPIEMGVDIVFFDMEDQGTNSDQDSWGKGAQHWSRNLHVPGYRPKYGVLLDMVGTKNARFGKEAYSMQFAREPLEKIWKLAQNMGYSDLFVNDNVGAVTDDHFFVNTISGIPMLDIINKPVNSDSGFGPHWHTITDDLNIIDKRTLRVVGQVVTTALYRESGGTL